MPEHEKFLFQVISLESHKDGDRRFEVIFKRVTDRNLFGVASLDHLYYLSPSFLFNQLWLFRHLCVFLSCRRPSPYPEELNGNKKVAMLLFPQVAGDYTWFLRKSPFCFETDK